MQYPRSTYEILAFKSLHRDIGEAWIDWALEMLSAGFDTEHLIILAGTSLPANQFYLDDLTTKVLNELQLDSSFSENILYNYTLYLAEEARSGNRSYSHVTTLLKDIYLELKYEPPFLRHFYLLYFALEDLKVDKTQHYWPDLNRDNTQSVLSEFFQQWREEHYYR